MTVAFGLSVGAQSGSGSAVLDDSSSSVGATGSSAAGSAGIGACANDGAAVSGAGAAGAGGGADSDTVVDGKTTDGDADDSDGVAGTVSHAGAGTAVVVVVVGGAVVVVVGEVVVGVAHGSMGAGASSAGTESGAALGVGTGVVDGCANAAEVPEININATVPAVNNDRDTERDRPRGGRKGFDTIIVGFASLRTRFPNRAAPSIFTDASQIHNSNRRNNLYKRTTIFDPAREIYRSTLFGLGSRTG